MQGTWVWSGKIPHAVEQLSPWAITTEPTLYSPCATNKRSPHCWKPVHAMKSSLHSSLLEKAWAQQWRPSTTKNKNKWINKPFLKKYMKHFIERIWDRDLINLYQNQNKRRSINLFDTYGTLHPLSIQEYLYRKYTGTSLVAHWLRICLSMQGTQVWFLV